MLVIDISSNRKNNFITFMLTRVKSQDVNIVNGSICSYEIKIMSNGIIYDLEKEIDYPYGDSLSLSRNLIRILIQDNFKIESFLYDQFRYKKSDPICIDISMNRKKYLQCFQLFRTKDKLIYDSLISSPYNKVKTKKQKIFLDKDIDSILLSLIDKVFELYEDYNFNEKYRTEEFFIVMDALEKRKS